MNEQIKFVKKQQFKVIVLSPSFNQQMGGVCFSQSALHHNVHKLPNQLPFGDSYIMRQSHSVRFSQVTVNRINSPNSHNNSQYKFVMKIFMSSLINDSISVDLKILNQNIQKLLTDNYQLKIRKRMIMDIFSKKLSSTLVQAINERSSVQFSIQVFSFRGYTSQIFKKCLYTLYILTKKISQIQHNTIYYHKLIDHFVYGCNPDKQAVTFLYERAQTSLANIAEYRKLAEWPWTTQEKLKIFVDLMNGLYYLHKSRIYHRDIRPSNIFYIQRLGRYVIGSFDKCIELNDDSQEQLNRTVYGIQYTYQYVESQRLNKIAEYLREGKQLAPYSPREVDYHGLGLVLHTLQTMDVLNVKCSFKDKTMLAVYNEFKKIYNSTFDQVRQRILQITQKFDVQHLKLPEDNQISNITQRLASVTHRSTIEEYVFEIYDTLGYQKQFSNTTHQLIQKNNERNKSLQNAYLLKNLGEFFEKNGAKGTEYYCNACLLFLKRTERNLNYGNIQKAKEQYYQAEKCYIKFSQNFESHSTYLQLHRIKALLKMHEKEIPKALEIIKQTFQYGAKRKISIEKQMTLLLTYAKIHLKGSSQERKIGEEKLKNGLAICENKGAFENISSCNIHTANFLFQLGSFYCSQIWTIQLMDLTSKYRVSTSEIVMNQILKNQIDVKDASKFKALTESNLKACLQIRQRENIETIQIIQVLMKLGYFYFNVELFIEAKKTFERCQTLLKEEAKEVNPLIVVKTLYFFGSTLYSLKEFNQAERKYKKALEMFDTMNEYSTNYLMKYSIEGNLGLTQLQLGRSVGQKHVLQAMNKIKQARSDKFYDYVFLKEKYSQIQERRKRKN